MARRTQSAAPRATLDRRDAVPALIGDASDFMIVAGLAGTARDVAALTADGSGAFALAGAMGAAAMIGLGLTLARPDRRVLVVTGDGELLMNLGALATIAVVNPPNLAILCVDNGRYEETGGQWSHTSRGVDLAGIAAAAGIADTSMVETADQIPAAARLLRRGGGTRFVLLRVKPGEAPAVRRVLDAAACRTRFRQALLGRP